MNSVYEFFNLETNVKKYTADSLKPTLVSISQEKETIEAIQASLLSLQNRVSALEQNNFTYLQEKINIINSELTNIKQTHVENNQSLSLKIERISAECKAIIPAVEDKLVNVNRAFDSVSNLSLEIKHLQDWFDKEKANIIQNIHTLQSSHSKIISTFDSRYDKFDSDLKIFKENYERIQYNGNESSKIIKELTAKLNSLSLNVVDIDNRKIAKQDYEASIKNIIHRVDDHDTHLTKTQTYLSNIEEYISLYIPLQTHKQMGDALMHFTSDEYKKKMDEYLFRKIKSLYHNLIYYKANSLLFQMKSILTESGIGEEDIKKIPNPALLAMIKDSHREPASYTGAENITVNEKKLKPIQIFDEKSIQTDAKFQNRLEEVDLLSQQVNIKISTLQNSCFTSIEQIEKKYVSLNDSIQNECNILHNKVIKIEKIIHKISRERDSISKPINDELLQLKEESHKIFAQNIDIARIIKLIIEERLLDSVDIVTHNGEQRDGLIIKNTLKRQTETDIKISFRGKNYKINEINSVKKGLIKKSAEMCNNLMQINYPIGDSVDMEEEAQHKLNESLGNIQLINKFPTLGENKKNIYSLKTRIAKIFESDKERHKLDLTIPLSTKSKS